MTTAVRLSATTHLNSVQFANQGTAPTTPASGYQRLYFASDGVKWVNESGQVNAALEVQSLAVKKSSGDVSLAIDSAAAAYRTASWRTAGLNRWSMYADNTAESGSQAGSNFNLSRYNDDGSFGSVCLQIQRNGSDFRILGSQLTIDGALNHDGGTAGFYGNTPVSRQTYGAPTGTATRTTFATGSVTLVQLAERVKALIDDLRSVGLVG